MLWSSFCSGLKESESQVFIAMNINPINHMHSNLHFLYQEKHSYPCHRTS